ncbi:MAG: hypothetical protein H9W82_19025 [Lactobacillus sp.]|nr:hypothetical protein [Lactobacillus sp.]
MMYSYTAPERSPYHVPPKSNSYLEDVTEVPFIKTFSSEYIRGLSLSTGNDILCFLGNVLTFFTKSFVDGGGVSKYLCLLKLK